MRLFGEDCVEIEAAADCKPTEIPHPAIPLCFRLEAIGFVSEKTLSRQSANKNLHKKAPHLGGTGVWTFKVSIINMHRVISDRILG
jgi:hypothetical protein